jgi:hypothetical protein
MGASEPGTAVISLGTSDTVFTAIAHKRTDPRGYGSVFGNPAGGFMSLACFSNGSRQCETIRQAAAALRSRNRRRPEELPEGARSRRGSARKSSTSAVQQSEIIQRLYAVHSDSTTGVGHHRPTLQRCPPRGKAACKVLGLVGGWIHE